MILILILQCISFKRKSLGGSCQLVIRHIYSRRNFKINVISTRNQDNYKMYLQLLFYLNLIFYDNDCQFIILENLFF